MSDLVQRARELAYRAHGGQVDKAGRPYIDHVRRVADTVAVTGDEQATAIAWLHDVYEDCAGYGDELFGMPSDVLGGVLLLSRGWNVSMAYYDRIKRNPRLLRVKLADIADNADEARLALLDEKTADRLRRKYANARKALGVTE